MDVTVLQARMESLVQEYGKAACEHALRQCRSQRSILVPDESSVEGLLDASLDGCLLVNGRDARIEWANMAAVHLFGYSDRSQLVGRVKLMDLVGGKHPEKHHSIDYLRRLMTEVKHNKAKNPLFNRMRDVQGRLRDGKTTIPLQVSVAPLPHGNQFVAYCHDLRRHKRQLLMLQQDALLMEQQAKDQEELLHRILDASMDAIFVTDAQGIILKVNSVALQEFRFASSQEAIGSPIHDLVGGGHGGSAHAQYVHDYHVRRRRAVDENAASFLLGHRRRADAKRVDGTEFPCQIGIQEVRLSRPFLVSQKGGADKAQEGDDTCTIMVGFVRNIAQELQAMEDQIQKLAAEELLANMLPPPVVDRLLDADHANRSRMAHHFDHATVLFADICGFTKMSSTMEPIVVVDMLNNLFSRFDETLDSLGAPLNKIKTIGDCYMVTDVPGVQDKEEDPSFGCAQVCRFALNILKQLEAYNQEHPDLPSLNLRIGINQGSAVAGIVGKKRFLYDIWGHAVNLASRMESTGVPGKIQVAPSVYKSLAASDEFVWEPRTEGAEVKGIGHVETYFLEGRRDLKPRDDEVHPVASRPSRRESWMPRRDDAMKLSQLMTRAMADSAGPFDMLLTAEEEALLGIKTGDYKYRPRVAS